MRTMTSSTVKRGQRGVVLFVAMIVLVVMALAGLAMIRQSGTGLSIAGNLAFKQGATSTGDYGTESAVKWWLPLRGTPSLAIDVAAEGYYSDWGAGTSRVSGDPSLYDWANLNPKVVLDDGTRAGNDISYIIERLCASTGLDEHDPTQLCVKTPPTGGGDNSVTCENYSSHCEEDRFFVQYRISTRIQGPKKTLSYIQVMVH